jgi:NADH-quinone oxidoreductase subunit N
MILNSLKSTLIIIDGLLEIKEVILVSEIILSILVLIILTYCEYDKLLIIWLNIIGIVLLLESNDLIITFVSLELYNITIYLLIGNSSSGLKYFILSCIFSTIFLLGLILAYNNFGNTQLEIIKLLQYYDSSKSNFFILLAILFKLGLFPFHQWLPDLYDNLTGSLIIWLQIISKYALFIWLYNINYLFQSLGN